MKIRDMITIDKDENLSHALEVMEKEGISRLLVTENGKIVGILTEEDVVERLITGKERILKTEHIHVSSAMVTELKTIPVNSRLNEIASIMLSNGFSSLPVTEDNEIVGIITKTDLVETLKNSDYLVERFYTKDPVLTSPADTLTHARKIMLESGIHRLLVMDRGVLIGILTERDIARGLRTFRKAIDKYPQADLERLIIEQVMTPNPLTIKPETTIGRAVKLMLKHKISGLPVICNDFGILTKTDLVRGIERGKFG